MIAALLLMIACGTPAPESGPVADALFPHPAGYDAGTAHGQDARGADAGKCFACHGGSTPTAPTCNSCHASYPHGPGWLGRHDERADEGCAACHGEGEGQISCRSCHTTFPHPADWKDAHGAAALARGDVQAACGGCHGPKLLGTPTAPACTSCHALYPHPEGFNHRVLDPSQCVACHGEKLDGGRAGVSCDRCHPTYPHVDDWKQTHFATALVVGEPVCLTCHDPGDGRNLPAATCGAACHGGAR